MKQTAQKSSSPGFWNFYANVYDTLLRIKPYEQMLEEVRSEIQLPRGSSILDAGCGTGNLSRILVDAGFKVTSVDAYAGMLQRTGLKCSGCVRLLADLGQPLDFPESSFDAVVCSNVLYALPNPAGALEDFERLLKPGGALILTNPVLGFDMGAVLRTHWKNSNWPGRARLLWDTPAITLLALFNLYLLRNKQLYFPGETELAALLDRVGYQSIAVRPTYARQGWLARARKAPLATLLLPLNADIEMEKTL